ncbi:hypothetical protein PT015_20035 [Candidatus Mycobacterium wuenschmannii]|uniref:Secreted protein n=1 Tax=Candidatus Mycobacterium wuenschmannii TaxID=3027808 RepID=A0ABY8VWR4_9MYCO|nr:hypothetical protein [Candidatus Mycobacterium wuenschmannii]WIM87132.1 hypothetical protein PT015_20035 [Candidatus Mycobacterium wuenschmannii]
MTIAKIAAAPVLWCGLLMGAALQPAGLAHAAPGATFTIVNNTGKDMWLDEWFLETPASATFGPGRVPPGSYTVRTKSDSELQAKFTLGDQRHAMVSMKVTNGVPQIQCLTNYGNCSPRGNWANDSTATFTS